VRAVGVKGGKFRKATDNAIKAEACGVWEAWRYGIVQRSLKVTAYPHHCQNTKLVVGSWFKDRTWAGNPAPCPVTLIILTRCASYLSCAHQHAPYPLKITYLGDGPCRPGFVH
jgi:hypothetical protein